MKIKQMRASGFTLVEIMIVVAIIGLLIAVAVPNFSKMRKDAQKTACHAQLKQIDGSKEMWATQEKRADGDTPSDSQLGVYFKGCLCISVNFWARSFYLYGPPTCSTWAL